LVDGTSAPSVTGAADHPRSGGPHLHDIDQTDGLSPCVLERTVVYVTSLPEPSSPDDIVTDLVEYLVLVLSGPHALPDVGPRARQDPHVLGTSEHRLQVRDL
jgi:hypothetical protein